MNHSKQPFVSSEVETLACGLSTSLEANGGWCNV
jgi:hypothetical protein